MRNSKFNQSTTRKVETNLQRHRRYERKILKKELREEVSVYFDPEQNELLQENSWTNAVKVLSVTMGGGKTWNSFSTLIPAYRKYGMNIVNFIAPSTEIAHDIEKMKVAIESSGLVIFDKDSAPHGTVMILDKDDPEGDPRNAEKIMQLRVDYPSMLIIVPTTPSFLFKNSELRRVFEHRNALILVDECHWGCNSDSIAAFWNNGVKDKNYKAKLWTDWVNPLREYTTYLFFLSATPSVEQISQRRDENGEEMFKMVIEPRSITSEKVRMAVAHCDSLEVGYSSDDVDTKILKTEKTVQELYRRKDSLEHSIKYYLSSETQDYSVKDAFGVNTAVDIPSTVLLGICQTNKGNLNKRIVFDTIHDAVKEKKINFRSNHYYITTCSESGTRVFNHNSVLVAEKNGGAPKKYSEEGQQFLGKMTDHDCWKTLVNECSNVVALFVMKKGGMGVDCPRIKHVVIYNNPVMSNDDDWLTKTTVQQLGRATRQWFGGVSGWKQFKNLPLELQKSVYDNCYCWTGLLPDTPAALAARADMNTKHSVMKDYDSIYSE